jgi:hypothetical protein
MNVEYFYDEIEDNLDLHSDILRDFIFANISVGLTRTEEMKKDIERLYVVDKLKYYKVSQSSEIINNNIMLQGSLEQEIYARKMLGILLVGEEDKVLRNEIIKLLRKYYYLVYRAVKKCSNKELISKYLKLDCNNRMMQRRLDSAVYLYFVMYCYAKNLDNKYITAIINDIKAYQLYSPMTTDIDKERENNKSKIEKISAFVKDTYGEYNNYKDILNSNNCAVTDIACILKNIFIINKIDMNELFNDLEDIDIDNLILSYLKWDYEKLEPEVVIQTIINGIFIQSLISKYERARELYFKNSHETLYFELNALQEKIEKLEKENKDMKSEVKLLRKDNENFDKTLNNEINKLNKIHKSEVIDVKKDVKVLENKLDEERKYRNELNALREYMFDVKNQYIPIKPDKTLDHYISDKNILIIGGTKEWRMKFKQNYNQIRTLTGFNDNFDMSILKNMDYIFFYTGFMSHSTYNKAMRFIRVNQVKFGYIGKTNVDLVEEEIIEEIKKYDIGRRLNSSS